INRQLTLDTDLRTKRSPIFYHLYDTIAYETGFRENDILDLRYKHIKSNYEKRIIPIYIDLQPEKHRKGHPAGYTFLGLKSKQIIDELIKTKQLDTNPQTKLIPIPTPTLFRTLKRAMKRAGIDTNTDKTVKATHSFHAFYKDAIGQIPNEIATPTQRALLEGVKTLNTMHYKPVTPHEIEELRKIYRYAYTHSIDI